ncbi:hypothetical protein [Burkholderia sp. Bp9004]|uniref:hypothetical protein n=1 Tax=Burkholderia sp. Bp9004 TaxID=2184559 RepID=UPI000F5F51EC|nr:hypothetical protein [Burkholderia sp. Bp9004]
MQFREKLTCINAPTFESEQGSRPIYLQMNEKKPKSVCMHHRFQLALPERTKGQYRDGNARTLFGFFSIGHGRVPLRFE